MSVLQDRNLLYRLLKISLASPVLLLVCSVAQGKPIRIAFLDFGKTGTGKRAADEMQKAFTVSSDFEVVDQDQVRSAARGAGYDGSLNLSLEEARNLGAAIGCDFFFMGDAQTFRRSPSERPMYFESYAVIFLVSARTGRLVSWEKPSSRDASAQESENDLLANLRSADSQHRYVIAIRRAIEDERAERISAVEAPPQAIEVMSDEASYRNDLRTPRPYRRLKPPYPAIAAAAEVEAIVDVLVDVDAHGEVGRIEIARWAGYGLDQSVIETVKQMHFFPAMRDGVVIPMRVLLRYNFRKPQS